MHASTLAFLQAVRDRIHCACGAADPHPEKIMKKSGDALTEAFTLQMLFDRVELDETDAGLVGKIGELESSIGALDRELRKLREQVHLVERCRKQLHSAYERIAAPLIPPLP